MDGVFRGTCMKIVKTAGCLTFCSVLSLVADASGVPNTWYVNAANYGQAGLDGLTPATAFGSLQEANDSDSVAAGDVIKVMPGDYNQGPGSTHAENARLSRLVVTKPLVFESTGGKDVTHVVGVLSSTDVKYGADGMRCVYVASTAAGTRFHGITFRDGSTDGGSGGGNGTDTGEGGGICVYGAPSIDKNAAIFSNAYIVDCVVSNCFGNWNGGIRGGTAIRTLIKDCGGKSWGESAISAALWNCVIDGNINSYGNSERPAVGHRSLVVNCTFHGCDGSGTRGNTYVYNCVFTARQGMYDVNRDYGGQYYPVGQDANNYGMDECKFALFAPAVGDYRLLAGTVCENGGKTSYLTDIMNLPDWVEMKDFNGNPIDVTKETCDAGAVQGAVAAGCGRLVFAAGTTVDGYYNRVPSYAHGEKFPFFRRVKPSNRDFFRYKTVGFYRGTPYRYAMYDGTVGVCHPPFASDAAELTEETVTQRYWVDGGYDGADSDGSETKPYVTIQDAMDAVASCGAEGRYLVTVAPGDYEDGGMVFSNVATRVVIPDRHVLVKSSGGAAVTRIKGKAATVQVSAAFPGCGSDAARCVGLVHAPSDCSPAIQGFTLADGHTDLVPNSENKLADEPRHTGGGIFTLRPDHSSFQVLDCVFTNCVGVRSGASGSAFHSRCSFYGCIAYGGVFRLSYLSGCYVDPSCEIGTGGGYSMSGGAVLGTRVRSVHCTVPKAGNGWVSDGSTEVPNAWKYSDAFVDGAAHNNHIYWGSVFGSFPEAISAIGQAVSEMRFTAPEDNDWRIWTGSPALTAGVLPRLGTAEHGLWASNYAAYASTDLHGEGILVTDGVPAPGCFQVPVKGVYIAEETDGITLSGGQAGGNELTDGFSLTLSESGTGRRPCIGVTLNGVTNLFEQSESVTIGASEVNAAGGYIHAAPVYVPHWYVDDINGSDSNSGFRPGKAKRTLAAAMRVDGLAAGDTVHAAPGTYGDETADGVMDSSPGDADNNHKCRVSVPAGVILVADQGAGKTVIAGEADGSESSVSEMGPGAVRCVKLNATASAAARLKGFTLAGGRSNSNVVGAGQTIWGGGVLGDNAYREACVVEDCIISNNVAHQGGGAVFVTALRCRFFDNRAKGGGGAGYYVGYHECLIDRSRSGETSAQAACWCYYDMIGCTIGADNMNFYETTGNNAVHAEANANALFFGNLVLGTCNNGTMTVPASNCVFAAGSGNLTVDRESCFYASEAVPVEVDENLRPVIGRNVAVDAALSELLNGSESVFDVTGVPRVMNGARDIGALEADWRPRYTADITSTKRFAVTDVTPNVVESAQGTVVVNPSQSLKAEWTGSEGDRMRRSVSFRVTGGALTVSLNGEDFVFASSDQVQTFTFANALALNELVFTCDGSAIAEMISASRSMGTVLSIR